MWLEMSREETHGGGDWAFTKCLWAPTHKKNAGTWRYWDLLRDVKAGDVVIHLRGKGKTAAFVGYSTAEADAQVTSDRPPNPGRWSFAKSFLRVPLGEYVPFKDSVNLQTVFLERDAYLREYFFHNKQKGRRQKYPIFFVVQRNKLQCLNGAYFTQLDSELLNGLFGLSFQGTISVAPVVALTAVTREQMRYMAVRVGQRDFSSEVRKNFNNRCCFPGCSVDEPELLVGSHIARWADVEKLRGETSNGLCLCLMHDKAFEQGWFTLDANLCVVIDAERVKSSGWAAQHILPFANQSIAKARIRPGFASIRGHWERTGFRFDVE